MSAALTIAHSEHIACAAIRLDGHTYTLPVPARHNDIIAHMRTIGKTPEQIAGATQGFMTNMGLFVMRKAALKVALRANQVADKLAPHDVLFSEDMW